MRFLKGVWGGRGTKRSKSTRKRGKTGMKDGIRGGNRPSAGVT